MTTLDCELNAEMQVQSILSAMSELAQIVPHLPEEATRCYLSEIRKARRKLSMAKRKKMKITVTYKSGKVEVFTDDFLNPKILPQLERLREAGSVVGIKKEKEK